MNSVTQRNACSYPECGRRVNARGLCLAHSIQARKGQELQPIESRFNGTLAERLEHGTSKGAGCWVWSRAIDSDGYGTVTHGRKSLKAHRVAYELEHGPIPDRMQIDHTCHNRSCVRPSHLQLATNKQNGENRLLNANNKSGARGVSWSKDRKSWYVQVGHHGVIHRVGYFKSLDDAKHAALAKRDELYTNNLTDHPELMPA